MVNAILARNGKAGILVLNSKATGKHGKWILEALSLSSITRFLMANQVLCLTMKVGMILSTQA